MSVAWKQELSSVTGVVKEQMPVLNYDVAVQSTCCSWRITIPHYKANIDCHGITIAYLGMKTNSGLILAVNTLLYSLPPSLLIRDVQVASRQVESC